MGAKNLPKILLYLHKPTDYITLYRVPTKKFKKFHDFSLTSKEISLTILSTTGCLSILYVNILDKSQWWS